MKKCLVFLGLLVLYISCTTVSLSRHPDFYFPPTNPDSVALYDQMTPAYDFYIIGQITIDATWSWSGGQVERSIRKKAAAIGGDGVIITSIKLDVVAINTGTTTTGTANLYGNTIYYNETTRNNTTYIPTKTLYGYVIKRR